MQAPFEVQRAHFNRYLFLSRLDKVRVGTPLTFTLNISGIQNEHKE
jgi:hypothetical protein